MAANKDLYANSDILEANDFFPITKRHTIKIKSKSKENQKKKLIFAEVSNVIYKKIKNSKL